MARSHRDIALLWAQGTERRVQGHNMFVEGATLYSYGYHFPLGRWTADKSGNPMILLNARDYSVSTAKHKGHAWSAAYHAAPTVPRFTIPDRLWGDHDACLAYLLNEAVEEVKRAKRARVYKDLGRARDLFATARDFAERFGVDVRPHFLPLAVQNLAIAALDLREAA